MHDTAYRIGGLVMDTYLPSVPARILEIGALNVNGTLRDHSPRNAEYIGLDFEAGDGVDIVISGLDDWNVPDAHFDLVMASSVFEHDTAFWRTFLEMCRKTKPGGHIYVSAPSNGTVHRYPKDCWRFYPDSGLALEEWARSEGFELTMIESFIAEREAEVWNDFCAVFRLGPCDDELNRNFVHDKVRSTNALNWRSSLTVNAVDDTEDTRLLRAAREEGRALHEAVRMAREEGHAAREEERARFQTVEARLHALHAEEIEARARQISDLSREVERQKAELDRLIAEAQSHADQHEEQSRKLATAVAELESEREDKIALKRSLSARIDELAAQKSTSEQRLQERFREIAGLTRLIQERDQVIANGNAQVEWLRQVVSVLTRGFSKSHKARLAAWLPTYFSHKRQRSWLKQQGLFDPDAYTAIYSDVSTNKIDPLRHYINHGIKEGRVTRQRS